MPYMKEICVAGEIIEISFYHTCRLNIKGEKREKKGKGTPDCQRKINIRLASKKLRREMNANFNDADSFLTTWDYRPEYRPTSSKEMQDDIRACLQILRRGFKKEGKTLKYIYVKELGKRGAAHIHILMSKCSLKLLKKAWTKGAIHVDILYSNGQYGKIAEYFLKYSDKTVETEGKLIGRRWNPSKNLIHPVPEKKIVRHVNSYYERIHKAEQKLIQSGEYYLEKDSMISGFTRDGYGYFTYTLHRAVTNKTRGSGESR